MSLIGSFQPTIYSINVANGFHAKPEARVNVYYMLISNINLYKVSIY